MLLAIFFMHQYVSVCTNLQPSETLTKTLAWLKEVILPHPSSAALLLTPSRQQGRCHDNRKTHQFVKKKNREEIEDNDDGGKQMDAV